MKCDVCNQEMENSEELKKHVAQAHRIGDGEQDVAGLESPDMLGDTPEESAATEAPLPTH